jgi:hypothetical protein
VSGRKFLSLSLFFKSPIDFSLLFSSLANGEVDHKVSLVKGGLNYVITSELTQISSETCPNATITPCLHKALRNVLTSHDDNEELHPMWEVSWHWLFSPSD